MTLGAPAGRSSLSSSRSWAAAPSMRFTASEVTSALVPSGMVSWAATMSPSIFGKKTKSMKPPPTRPPKNISVLRAIERVR